jgi:hypothetical protein
MVVDAGAAAGAVQAARSVDRSGWSGWSGCALRQPAARAPHRDQQRTMVSLARPAKSSVTSVLPLTVEDRVLTGPGPRRE